MTNTFFQIMLTATWQSMVLAAIVLLITLAFRERLAPRFRYLLWCVVLLRLALPILPATPWGILPNQNHAKQPFESPQRAVVYDHGPSPMTPPLEHAAPSFPAAPAIQPVVETPVQHEIQVVTPQNATLRAVVHDHGHLIALAVWLFGIIVLGIRYVCDELRLWRQSRYWKPVENAALLAAFDACRKQLGIRRHVALLAVSHGIGAASTGTIFPKVLLSEQAVFNSDAKQLRLVILHELVHLKRFDPLVLRVSVILSVIHWLNPVVWLVSSRLQRDRELACDAAVLHILDMHDSTGATQKDYGEAVLTFATHFSRSGREHLPGLVGLFPKHAIARRIEMILNYKKSNIFYAIFGVLLVLTVAAFGLTRAANPIKSQQPESTPPTATKQADVKVRGHVTDADGKPIEGALLVWQTEVNDYWENRQKAVKTDKDGFYESPELKAVPGTVTVIAEGFAPDMKTVEFKKDMQPVDFTLKPGKTLEIRFVDKDGKPVPGVGLMMGGNPDPWWRNDSNIYIYMGHDQHANTKIPDKADENGVYRWTWAPEDKIRFDFYKEGFMRVHTQADSSKPNNWFVAGEKYTIIMYPELNVSGTVVDDETSRPVSEFKVVPGNILENYYPGGIIWQTPQSEEFKDGKFEHTFDYANEDGYRVRIDAEGYESYASNDMVLGETKREFNIRLKKYAGMSGTVLLPDGTPAANTKIYVSGSGGYLQVTNPPESVLLSASMGRLTTVADSDGKFTIFQKPEDRFGMYLEHPQGLAWVKSDDFRKNNEVRLHGFAKKLEVILPPQYISGTKQHFTIWAEYGSNDGFGHIDYQREISPKEKQQYDFDNIVAGKHRLTIWQRSPMHEWVQGSGAFESFNVPFEIKEGETKTLNLDVPGTQVMGKIKLPDTVKKPFTERDWAYNRIELTRDSEVDGQPSKLAVTLKKSETESQTGTFQFNRVPAGTYAASARIYKAPENSTTMDAGSTDCLVQLTGQVIVPEETKTIEMPALARLISLWNDDDALIFSKGQWTNEKTGEVLPGGSIVQGTEGTFRIEQEGEIGKVVKLSGYGTVGDGLYVKFSKGGNKIDVSAFPIEIHKEFEEHGIVIGQDDVFVYDNGEWKNEKTGGVIPMGNLVASTRGIFRLEEENGEGKITLLGGAGATGHGKYIRWSHGGNGFSGSRP